MADETSIVKCYGRISEALCNREGLIKSYDPVCGAFDLLPVAGDTTGVCQSQEASVIEAVSDFARLFVHVTQSVLKNRTERNHGVRIFRNAGGRTKLYPSSFNHAHADPFSHSCSYSEADDNGSTQWFGQEESTILY